MKNFPYSSYSQDLGRERDLYGVSVKEGPIDKQTVGCLVLG